MAESDSNQAEFYYPSADVIAQAYVKSWDEVARQADADFVVIPPGGEIRQEMFLRK